jgi:acyl-CoA thioester hydrolase
MPAKPLPATIAADSRKGTFRHPLRVYWEDTDAGGVVFYANYLKFFERARTEWLRALGFSQQHMLQHDGVIFVVTDTALRYLRAARLDDAIEVSVQLLQAGRASLRLAQQAWRGDELLAEGDIRIGCVKADARRDFRPCRIPAAILDKIA